MQEDLTVTASYDETTEQVRKISKGETADIFIGASSNATHHLKQQGLIDIYSIHNIAKNRLALIAAKGSRLSQATHQGDTVQEKLHILNNRTILVMADDKNTVLGTYSKQALNHLETDLAQKILSNSMLASNCKHALYLISYGDKAGIVYYSDAYQNPHVDILSLLDEHLHTPIIYQAAVVAGNNMAHARGFIDFLKSKTSLAILEKHGFMVE